MKVLAVIAGGMGNQIQMTAAVRTLRERLGWEVDFFSTGLPGPRNAHAMFDPVLPGQVYNGLTLPRSLAAYDGAVQLTYGATGDPYKWAQRGAKILNDPDHQRVTVRQSEVDTSMNACRDLGVAEDDLIWHGHIWCADDYLGPTGGYTDVGEYLRDAHKASITGTVSPKLAAREGFDIVLSNGYWRGTKERPSNHWHVRGYPDYPELVAALTKRWPGLSICCIGADDRERIDGVTDRTGLHLLHALAVIKRARLLITTDTMAFHAAACFDTPTIALWTATCAVKSACPRFHATATLVGRDDLECRATCYGRQCYWLRCPDWQCQKIPVADIMAVAERELEGCTVTTGDARMEGG